MLKSYKVLITGGSGLLATNWAIIRREIDTIMLIYNNKEPRIDNTSNVIVDPSDFGAMCKLVEGFGPDLIINAAGLTNIEVCQKYPEHAFKVNQKIAENVARVSQRYQKKIIHISTDHLFSGENKYSAEQEKPDPLNVYAETKLEAERAVQTNCENFIIVRTNFYGWGTSYRRSFSDFIIDALRKGKSITLFHDVYFSPMYVRTFIQTIYELIEINAIGTYNVAGSERLSKLDFGLRIAETFGLSKSCVKEGSLRTAVNFVKRPLDMSLDISKVERDLGKKIPSLNSDLLSLKEDFDRGYADLMRSIT